MGLMDYVVEHRVWHAQRLLATTDAKVLDVALDSGFGFPSRFYEAFQRSCKVSPRQYRLQFIFGAKGPATHKG